MTADSPGTTRAETPHPVVRLLEPVGTSPRSPPWCGKKRHDRNDQKPAMLKKVPFGKKEKKKLVHERTVKSVEGAS